MTAIARSGRNERKGSRADAPSIGLWSVVHGIFIVLAISETLRWAYEHLIYPEFSYFSYYLNSIDPFSYAIAIGLSVLCILTLPRKLERPSHTILWIIYVVAALPTILVPHYAVSISDEQALVISIQASVSMLAIILSSRRLNSHAKPILKVDNSGLMWTFIIAWTIVVYALLVARLGLPTSLPSLDDVYGVRDDYRSRLGGSLFLGYAMPAQASVVNPLFIARGLYHRRPQWVALGLGLQLVIFSYSGLKSVLLSTAALLLFYWLLTRRRPRGALISFGVLVGAFASMAMDVMQSTTIWTSLGIRRFIIVPGILSGAYVETFSSMDKAHWAYSFMGGFLDYPYSVAPSYLVGGLYFNRPDMNANANFFADGYANWGFYGVLVEAALIVLLLWLIDSSSFGLPNEFASLVFVVPAIAFANSSAFTTALTHGVVAGVILCTFLPRRGWVKEPKQQPAVK